MKTKLILSLLILSIGILSAQTITKPKKTYKYIHPYNDTLWRKNEIGFGISAPFLSSTLYKGLKNIDINIQYKRLLTSRDALRFGINYNENGNQYYTTTTYIPHLDFKDNDSIPYSSTDYNHNQSAYLNIGYEHYFGKKRVKFIIGSDLVVGFKDYTYYHSNQYAAVRSDTIGNLVTNTIVYTENLNNYHLFNLPLNHDYSLRLGMKTHIGARFPISNRLIFNFVTSITMGYEHVFNKNYTYKDHYYVDLSGIVSEVSLFYRF